MILYTDSSALVKKYSEEAGSREVDRLFKTASYVVTSALTDLEMVSFLERAKRETRINSATYREISANIDKDLRGAFISLIDITPPMLKLAKRLIRQRRLRVQDSIQLATALEANKDLFQALCFLCADQALLEAARLEGLRCFDVSK